MVKKYKSAILILVTFMLYSLVKNVTYESNKIKKQDHKVEFDVENE